MRKNGISQMNKEVVDNVLRRIDKKNIKAVRYRFLIQSI